MIAPLRPRTRHSQVVEIASNDGYLLQHFVARGIPVLGIEPAANVAEAAVAKGIPTTVAVLRPRDGARARRASTAGADLLLGNNVLAHVPDLNDFVAGMKRAARARRRHHDGVPAPAAADGREPVRHHLPRALLATSRSSPVEKVFARARPDALRRRGAADARRLAAHLRAPRRRRAQPVDRARSTRCASARARDGLRPLDVYRALRRAGRRRPSARCSSFLIDAKRAGKTVVGYGAPGKGNTLLNYCGIRTDFLDYTVDRNPHKQGKFTPGTHIPILPPDAIRETQPDYVLILPWNLKDEIVAAAGLHPRVGRPLRRADSRSHAARPALERP